MQEDSLKKKTIKGTAWSAIDAFLGQGVSFFVGIVLARLLSPEEYGLIGICLIFNTVLNGIVDSGFSTALIRKKEISDVDYNTMFITNLLISIVLYGLLFFSTTFIADFFSRPEIASLLRVTGLVLVINALSITQITILTKRVDFKTKTKASLIAAIFSGLVGILMAYNGFGVWSLVAQLVIKQMLYTFSLWFYNRWYPKWEFSRTSFGYMWGFGWKLLVSGLLNNVWNQLYQVVVGKFYSPAILGQYSRANDYAGIFSSNLTLIIQRVSFPVLSELQEDKNRMLYAYRRVIKMTMFVTAICMISLAAVSEPLIYCLIGPQWNDAASFLPYICVSMSLFPLHAINLNMLQVLGRSDIFLYLEIIKKFITIIPLCIGIFIDIYSMLIASVVFSFLSLYLNCWYTGKSLHYTFWKQLKDVLPSYSIAAGIAVSVYFFKELPLNYSLILPIQIIVGSFVGIVICEVFHNSEYLEIKNYIRRFLFAR